MKKTIKAEVGYDYIEYCKEKMKNIGYSYIKIENWGMRRQNDNLPSQAYCGWKWKSYGKNKVFIVAGGWNS